MKIFCLYGSKKGGSTKKAADVALGVFKDTIPNIEIDEIYLYDTRLDYCRGCNSCFAKGEDNCPHADIVQPIVQKMLDADLLIITSPAYALNISGVLKSFIDHTAYIYHRPALYGKTALVVTTTVGAGAASAAKYLKKNFEYMGTDDVYTISGRANMDKGVNEKYKEKLKNIALSIVKKKDKTNKPSMKNIMNFNMWKALNLVVTDGIDHEYWKDSGFLEKRYYYNADINIFKRIAGAMLLGIFKIVFKTIV